MQCICLGGKGRRCLLNLQRTVQVGSSAGSLVNNGGHWLPGGGRATALLALITAAARAGVVAARGWDGSPRRMARSVVPGTASRILVHHVLSRFSLQTCANRNERPSGAGQLWFRPPTPLPLRVGDRRSGMPQLSYRRPTPRHSVRTQGDDPASQRHLRIEGTLAETDVHDEELILCHHFPATPHQVCQSKFGEWPGKSPDKRSLPPSPESRRTRSPAPGPPAQTRDPPESNTPSSQRC